MTKTKTFVDANVLIAAWRGNAELLQKSMEILDDPDREFIVSDYLKLEVIPKPTFSKLMMKFNSCRHLLIMPPGR